MDSSHIITLALLQGLTEFLPISSSAHLILLPRLVDWGDQGLAFDVAVHFGTLTAVVAYFRHELRLMLVDWAGSVAGRGQTADSRLAWAVAFGTVPVGLAGLAFSHSVETYLRSPLVIAATTIGFGLLLGWADVRAAHRRDEHSIGWRDVLVIGLAQALALIPGTSRSGITMTAGLMLGLTRPAAARFSFLLSIPVIILAAAFETRQLLESDAAVDWNSLMWGIVLSAASAYLCIHVFLKLLDGIRLVLNSPYLLGISGLMLLFTTLATFLYFQQAQIISAHFADAAQRTRVFAAIDLAVNSLTILMQVFLTGRLVSWLGLPATLALVPLLLAVGFAALGVAPVLAVLVVVQVIRRAGNYAILRPGREMLYVVLGRREKYKAKNFIDTVVYRGGDVVSAWLYSGLRGLGLGLGEIAWLAVPLAGLWGWLAFALGRRQTRLAQAHRRAT